MISKFVAILFILPAISARIEIDIVTTNGNERDVRISGNYVDPITEPEMTTFNLSEEKLKKSISSYFGLEPENIYVKSPTPWGDLYKTLGWKQVTRSVMPERASILSVTSEPTLVSSKDYYNDEAETKVYRAEYRQYVQDTVSTKWQKEGDLNVDEIHYHFDMKTPAPKYYSFTSRFGENVEKSMPVLVGSKTVEITLKPKQNAIAELYVTKETMMIRVDYEARLSGSVAVNYDKEYKGHRFWAMDIETLLTEAGIKKTVHSSEIIEVVHFRDARVLVKDVDTKELIYTLPLADM